MRVSDLLFASKVGGLEPNDRERNQKPYSFPAEVLCTARPENCTAPAVQCSNPRRGFSSFKTTFGVTSGHRFGRATCEGAEFEGATHQTQYGVVESRRDTGTRRAARIAQCRSGDRSTRPGETKRPQATPYRLSLTESLSVYHWGAYPLSLGPSRLSLKTTNKKQTL
jgi:hypothetical protein